MKKLEKKKQKDISKLHNFVANYKGLGEKYILSAKVHLDESTPHMHLVFVPVIHKIDKKSGKHIDKIFYDDTMGEKTYEKAECKMLTFVIKNVMENARLKFS